MQMPNITLTDAAIQHIRAQLAYTESAYLRLGVKESGCNGYMYMMDFLEEPGAQDVCLEIAENVNVCVDKDHCAMVDGTNIDLITQGLNSAMVFKNAKATSYCGCGESFAVTTASGTTELDVGDLAKNAAED